MLREGRVQGSSKYVVQNETELNDDESLPTMELISRIGYAILKDPISDVYIPKPTFLVVG